MSHTCDAIKDRGSTSPWRRKSNSSKANSLAVRSMRWPARVARRFNKSSSRSANRKNSAPDGLTPRRNKVRTRANSSAKAKGLTK